MSSSTPALVALYDAHAPRLFALALRITGNSEAAVEALEEVFSARVLPDDLAGLVRLTRKAALDRYDRSAAAAVDHTGMEPVPRLLVEEAFFRGRSVADLAAEWSLPEERVQVMLRDGMTELRRQLGGKTNE